MAYQPGVKLGKLSGYSVEKVTKHILRGEGLWYRIRFHYGDAKAIRHNKSNLFDSMEGVQKYIDRFHPDLPLISLDGDSTEETLPVDVPIEDYDN